MRFFWFCAGANAQVLLRKDCYLDRGRYAAMGVTVLITACTAALAGGYTFYTVFNSTDWAIIFAIFWGLAIGNIDRFVIMSTRKVSKFSWRQMATASLRLIMAALIAFAMAKPLEMAFFRPEIDAEIERQNTETITSMREKAASGFNEEIKQLEQRNQKLYNQIELKEDSRDEAYQKAIAEAEGTSGTGLRGRGPVYKEKWNEFKAQREEYKQFKKQAKAEIDDNKERIDELRRQYGERVEKVEATVLDADGLLAQLQALHKLANKDPVVKWTSFFLTTVLVSIDVFPILAKLLSTSGQYDHIVEYEEQATIAREKQKVNDLKEIVKEESNYNRQFRKQKQDFVMDAYYNLHSEAVNSPEWESPKKEIVQAIVENTKVDLLDKVKNYRVNQTQVIEAVEETLPKVLEEIAYLEGKDFLNKERIERIKRQSINNLKQFSNMEK